MILRSTNVRKNTKENFKIYEKMTGNHCEGFLRWEVYIFKILTLYEDYNTYHGLVEWKRDTNSWMHLGTREYYSKY